MQKCRLLPPTDEQEMSEMLWVTNSETSPSTTPRAYFMLWTRSTKDGLAREGFSWKRGEVDQRQLDEQAVPECWKGGFVLPGECLLGNSDQVLGRNPQRSLPEQGGRGRERQLGKCETYPFIPSPAPWLTHSWEPPVAQGSLSGALGNITHFTFICAPVSYTQASRSSFFFFFSFRRHLAL